MSAPITHRQPPPLRPSMRREWLVHFLDLEAAAGVEGAQWENYQIAHLDDEGVFRIEDKSRQIAWSWTIAAEAVADAHADLWDEQPRDSIFVSINEVEAAEKIRYAKRIYEALMDNPLCAPDLHKTTADNTLNLEFANGARLSSLPAKPPRGRARSNVYLDEFAHVAADREIYTAAMPVISKGGRLRVGSSPFGAAGMFWEIFGQAIKPYPGYKRAVTPWYAVKAFCTDVAGARDTAPKMAPAEAVARFGNDRIKAIYANMPSDDDFLQEYCCKFQDETRSYFTWDEIRQAQRADMACYTATCTGADIDAALRAIDALAAAIPPGKVEEVYTAGYDVGRTHDKSELIAAGMATTDTYPIRLVITLDRAPYDAQEAVIAYALTRLPMLRLWIDQNGIGNQLAENLEYYYPAVAQGQTFTSGSKQLWATNAKRLFSQRRVILPAERDLAYQIHSIRKLITAGKTNVFDVDRNEKHHADKAWALFLALAAAEAGTGALTPADMQEVFGYL